MGGGKGGKAKQKVAEYRLSMHFGICHGPAILRKMWFGEKVGWSGTVSYQAAIKVDQPGLFGGQQKEGGVQGLAYFLPGDENQLMPSVLAAKFGLSPETCPAFRGMASVFLTGITHVPTTQYIDEEGGAQYDPGRYRDTSGITNTPSVEGSGARGVVNTFIAILGGLFNGFLWGMNTPYLKPFWATVTCPPYVDELPDDTAMIGSDANAAHIIFQCLTDQSFGMGAPTTAINVTSFVNTAQTLFDEQFGLSLGWFQQTTIENFIAEILDHIQATVYVNPATGLFEIKLLRDDYVFDDLPVFDESNSKLFDFQRRALGETVNEIVVTYTNPETEDDATVSVQDTGNIAAQGEVVSSSRNYYGVRTPDLAMELATRDVRTAAAPLASGVLEIDRRGYAIVPGSVIRVTNEREGLQDAVFRVGNVDYGKTNDRRIRINILEDIFSFEPGTYVVPPVTMHEDGEPPTPAAASKVFTMPWFFAKQFGGDTFEDGDVFAAVIATQNGSDTFSYELWSEAATFSGTSEYIIVGDRSLNAKGQLVDDLAAENQSLMTLSTSLLGVGPAINNFVMIGPDDALDAGMELALITDLDSNGDWVVERGMLDTVPRAWPAGTPIWFLSISTPFGDDTPFSAGADVAYKVLTRTSRGVLALGTAPELNYTLDARPDRPLRPAKVRANGEGYGEIDAVNADDIVITWANRNRDVEETQVLLWEDDGVSPPGGQTTVIRIYDTEDNLIAEDAGLGGETHTLSPYDYAGENLIRVNVKSSLGGVESLQGYDLYIRTGYGGWGLNWGFSWGGGS